MAKRISTLETGPPSEIDDDEVYGKHAILSQQRASVESNEEAGFAGFWLTKRVIKSPCFELIKERNVLAGTKTRGEGFRKFRTDSEQTMRTVDAYTCDYLQVIMGTEFSSSVGPLGPEIPC